MKKFIRMLLILTLTLGILALARNRVVWAGSTNESSQPALALDKGISAPLAKPDPGSVKPPPPAITVCKEGTNSIGGLAILKVLRLKLDYCLEAFLWNHAFAIGRIPDGAGKVLADITFLKVYYKSAFIYDVPVADGDVKICYAVPPGTQAQIYFFDFYGAHFKQRTGQPAWEPLETTVKDGIACAKAQTSGAYALIGK
jgi:hypothetical protein